MFKPTYKLNSALLNNIVKIKNLIAELNNQKFPKLVLARVGLDTFQLFSFENYYNQNVNKYFSSVGVLGGYYDIRENVDFTDGIIDELLRVQKLLKNSVLPNKLTEYEKVIVEYIKKNGSISKSEYKKITSRAHSTQILDFKRLGDKKVIGRKCKGKATYYILIES